MVENRHKKSSLHLFHVELHGTDVRNSIQDSGMNLEGTRGACIRQKERKKEYKIKIAMFAFLSVVQGRRTLGAAFLL